MAHIQFKTKVKKLIESDNTESAYIELKRRVKKSDCSLRPHEHTYYNSDLFEGILNRAYQAITHGKEWVRLNALPQHVTVDTSKFLAVVKIELPATFK